jgi:hypothetical protein
MTAAEPLFMKQLDIQLFVKKETSHVENLKNFIIWTLILERKNRDLQKDEPDLDIRRRFILFRKKDLKYCFHFYNKLCFVGDITNTISVIVLFA